MSAALELLRAAQEGDREACERAVMENNGTKQSSLAKVVQP